MGGGAIMTGGCNIGHIFGGIPELSLGSFVTIIFMLAGNWRAVFALNKWFGYIYKEFNESAEYEIKIRNEDKYESRSETNPLIVPTENDFSKPIVVDTRGEVCPIPLMLTRRAFRKISQEREFIIIGDHRQSLTDIPEYIERIHSRIVDIKEDPDGTWYIILKYLPDQIL